MKWIFLLGLLVAISVQALPNGEKENKEDMLLEELSKEDVVDVPKKAEEETNIRKRRDVGEAEGSRSHSNPTGSDVDVDVGVNVGSVAKAKVDVDVNVNPGNGGSGDKEVSLSGTFYNIPKFTLGARYNISDPILIADNDALEGLSALLTEKVRDYIMKKNLDPLAMEGKQFYVAIIKVTLKPFQLDGLSSFTAKGKLTNDGIAFHASFDELIGSCHAEASIPFFTHKIMISVRVKDTKALFTTEIDKLACKLQLSEFELDIGNIEVEVTGAGSIVNDILKKAISFMGGFIKQAVGTVSGVLKTGIGAIVSILPIIGPLPGLLGCIN